MIIQVKTDRECVNVLEEENMFCPKCGTKILDNAKFCAKCGEKITISNPLPPVMKTEKEKKSKKSKKKVWKWFVVLLMLIILLIAGVVYVVYVRNISLDSIRNKFSLMGKETNKLYLLDKEIGYDANGDVLYWSEYQYDEQGNQLGYITYKADGSRTENKCAKEGYEEKVSSLMQMEM